MTVFMPPKPVSIPEVTQVRGHTGPEVMINSQEQSDTEYAARRHQIHERQILFFLI